MKKSVIWKSVFREIRDSLGRFMAILAIVALGVGLFAGLKITKADFLKSTTEYYKETAFFDYRILGELGFSQSQVDYFAAQKEVRVAEGALSADMLFAVDGGGQQVGRFHSLTQNVNKVILVAGRMPEKPGECLADSQYYSASAIGRKVVLDEENKEADLDQFEENTFVIVGVVKSPVYIQFERGNTSLGNGSIDCFFYVPRESFASDYFTEIYIKSSRDFDLYSQEYQDYMDQWKPAFENYVEEACHQRLLEMPAILADARKEFEEKKKDAQAELDDAAEELEQARADIAEAEEKIADGRTQIKDGWEELEQAEKDLEEAKNTIAEKEADLEEGRQKLEDGKKTIKEKEQLVKEKEAELEAAKKTIETSQMMLQLGGMQQKLGMDEMIQEQKDIDKAQEKLNERTASVNAREEQAVQNGRLEEVAASLQKERDAIAKEQKALNDKLENLHNRFLDALEQEGELENGRKELEDALKQVQDGTQALQEGKDALWKGKMELIDAQRQVYDGEAAIREAKQEIRQGEKDLAEARKTLQEKEQELADAIPELEDGKQKYLEGMEEYQDGLEKFQTETEKAEKNLREQEEKLEKGEEPKGYLLGRNTNIGYVCFENDASIVDGIANVFPVFFFLVAALVCITTMNRMVEEQRTQIGVLKALGYSDGTIMFKFIFYSGLAALTGCIAGYAGGTHLFPFIIWTVYGIMYQAGPIAYTFSPVLAVFSLTVSLLCSVGTTWLSCGKELNGWAAQLMRPRAPKAGKRVFLEYVPFIWKRLGFLRKVAVRNIMRYKKRLFMMVLGIGGCTALLVTGFGIRDSIAGVGDMQYSEIQCYDVGLMLQKEVSQEFQSELIKLQDNALNQYLIYQESSQNLVVGDTQKSVTVIVLPEETGDEKLQHFLKLHTESGETIPVPGNGEVVITDNIASALHVNAGDSIIIRDENQKEMHLKVAAVARNYIYDYAYLGENTWEKERKEKMVPKSVWLTLSEGHEIHELSTAVMNLDGVANVSVMADNRNRFNTMMSSLNLIVVVVILCAAGLAFIVLYNLTNINITERIREIATIKVLGFYASETALYVFRENMVLTFLGVLAGLVMGKGLHAFVMHEVNVDVVSFAARIYLPSYIYSIILTFVFAFGVNLLMSRKLDQISMTESLKSVD